jgi:hypothetical protein
MHDDRTELLDRARQAVERGDHGEAHALAAIALADAGDELTGWVGNLDLKLESIEGSIGTMADHLGELSNWGDHIQASLGALASDADRRRKQY